LAVDRELVLTRGGCLAVDRELVSAGGRCLAVDRELVLTRGGCFEADLEPVALGAAARPDRGEEARGGAGAAARDDARGVPPDRSEDGRTAGGRRESILGVDVAERSLRAAGVTAVGVMLSSDLQLAGGAQVR
jgi:hypothetical protein